MPKKHAKKWSSKCVMGSSKVWRFRNVSIDTGNDSNIPQMYQRSENNSPIPLQNRRSPRGNNSFTRYLCLSQDQELFALLDSKPRNLFAEIQNLLLVVRSHQLQIPIRVIYNILTTATNRRPVVKPEKCLL